MAENGYTPTIPQKCSHVPQTCSKLPFNTAKLLPAVTGNILAVNYYIFAVKGYNVKVPDSKTYNLEIRYKLMYLCDRKDRPNTKVLKYRRTDVQ